MNRANTRDRASAAAMVTASARKNPPVTPPRKASGMKITRVDRLDPISGRAISAAACSACNARCSCPAGSSSAVTSINRQLRRKANRTMPASRAPSRMASRTLPAAAVTSSDWS